MTEQDKHVPLSESAAPLDQRSEQMSVPGYPLPLKPYPSVPIDFFRRMPGGGTAYKREDAMKKIAETLDIPIDVLGSSEYKCDGTHLVQTIKYVGTLEVLICEDPKCAHVTAKCTHETPIPVNEDSTPRKYTTSACSWNEDGTVLTCDFCGVDGT